MSGTGDHDERYRHSSSRTGPGSGATAIQRAGSAPPIPGQLLEKLAIEREGSFVLPEDADGLTLPAVVALSEGPPSSGMREPHSELDPAGQWFGAIDHRGKVTSSVVLAGEMSVEMVDVLAGHGGGERALLLGNVGTQGWVVSVDARGDPLATPRRRGQPHADPRGRAHPR